MSPDIQRLCGLHLSQSKLLSVSAYLWCRAGNDRDLIFHVWHRIWDQQRPTGQVHLCPGCRQELEVYVNDCSPAIWPLWVLPACRWLTRAQHQSNFNKRLLRWAVSTCHNADGNTGSLCGLGRSCLVPSAVVPLRIHSLCLKFAQLSSTIDPLCQSVI